MKRQMTWLICIPLVLVCAWFVSTSRAATETPEYKVIRTDGKIEMTSPVLIAAAADKKTMSLPRAREMGVPVNLDSSLRGNAPASLAGHRLACYSKPVHFLCIQWAVRESVGQHDERFGPHEKLL